MTCKFPFPRGPRALVKYASLDAVTVTNTPKEGILKAGAIDGQVVGHTPCGPLSVHQSLFVLGKNFAHVELNSNSSRFETARVML